MINNAGDTEIRRYHISGDPNVADEASMTKVLTIDQPNFTNHKAGWIDFGQDGLPLYRDWRWRGWRGSQ